MQLKIQEVSCNESTTYGNKNVEFSMSRPEGKGVYEIEYFSGGTKSEKRPFSFAVSCT